MLVFGGSPADTISTVISLTDSGSSTVKIGTIGDILNGKGILPINTSEMTYQDNQ
jgi:phosphopentomutase